MKYPGRIIRKGDADTKVVKAIQQRLEQLGIADFDGTGQFGPKTEQAIRLFQARSTDAQGAPLVIDGEVGAITWEALFGIRQIPATDKARGKWLQAMLQTAAGEVGVVEQPAGSNWGTKVKVYLQSVGLTTPNPWCVAFVYWCFDEVAKASNKPNPLPKTGGVLAHWNRTKGTRIPVAEAVNNPAMVKPGQVFVIGFPNGTGHMGIVESVQGGFITVIEGNTNGGGSREGIGVFRRTRKIASINRGFIEYQL
jgi:hypothetical protein